ncbi:MAG: tetrahydrofolate dehydrogenase/cyclohydrolase catalytic domain-containing protein, partial [Phycisphaeraceae bacterium]
MTTTAAILDGKAVAQRVLERCARRVRQIIDATGCTPGLATVLVGEDPASVTYTRMKRKRAESVGMHSQKIEMSASTTTEQLVARITELGADPGVHGILLQHPVPPQVNERAAFEAIGPAKDVDGVTIYSFGTTAFGLPGFGSCTPAGIMRLLAAYDVRL